MIFRRTFARESLPALVTDQPASFVYAESVSDEVDTKRERSIADLTNERVSRFWRRHPVFRGSFRARRRARSGQLHYVRPQEVRRRCIMHMAVTIQCIAEDLICHTGNQVGCKDILF